MSISGSLWPCTAMGARFSPSSRSSQRASASERVASSRVGERALVAAVRQAVGRGPAPLVDAVDEMHGGVRTKAQGFGETRDVAATPLWGVGRETSHSTPNAKRPTALELLGRVDRKVTRFGGASPTRLRLRRGQARPAPPRKPGVAAAPRFCHRLRDEPIHLGTLFRLRDAPRQHRRAGLLLRRGVATTLSAMRRSDTVMR